MPFVLTDLTNDLRWVAIEYEGQILNIGYRPTTISIELIARMQEIRAGDLEQWAQVMPTVVAEWDMFAVNGDGTMHPVEPTVETFRRLPIDFLKEITQVVYATEGDSDEKKMSAGISVGGSRPGDKSENVQIGTLSSGRPATWA
jgi:hypothetical protein